MHPGISRALSGSIAGIPLFSVTRSDPNQLDIWRRLTQFPNIFATKTYALSVVARAGSSPNLYVMMYQTNGFDVQVSVNVTTGAFTVVGQSGISGLHVQVQALDASTSFVTFFFTPTVNPGNPDIGFTSADTTVGSSVLITDVRLVNTADYCGP